MTEKHNEKNIFLHVGHGKTGSSAIQSFLALNTSLLLQHGFDYPARRALKLAREGKTTSGNLDNTTPSSWLQEVKRATKSAACANVLFSHERLFHLIRKEPKYLGLATKHYHTTVILYVRNPLDHFFSAYGQAVKRHGETREIEKWVDKYNQPIRVLDFLNICKNLDVPVIVRNYSNVNDIERSFAEMLLGDKAEEFLESSIKPQCRVNRSLTRAEYELLRQFNRYSDVSSGEIISTNLVDSLPHIISERDYVSEHSLNKIRARFGKTVDEINNFLDGDQKLELPVSIEPSEPSMLYSFSREQIEVIAKSVSALIERERKADALKRSRAPLPLTLLNRLRGKTQRLL